MFRCSEAIFLISCFVLSCPWVHVHIRVQRLAVNAKHLVFGNTRWRETLFAELCFATSCVWRRVGVRERCSSYVDLAVFFRGSVASPSAAAERERVWEEKMADDQLCGQGWFTAYSKCVWFRRGLLWLVWHVFIWTAPWKRCLWAIRAFLSIDWLLFDLEESCGAQEDY